MLRTLVQNALTYPLTFQPQNHIIPRIFQGLYINFEHFWAFHFLRASAMLKHVIDIGWTSVRPSVRPSVCLSVTRCYYIKTAEYIVMLSSPHDSPFILVLCYQDLREIPCGAAKQRWDVKISQFSTNNLLYIKNG